MQIGQAGILGDSSEQETGFIACAACASADQSRVCGLDRKLAGDGCMQGKE